MSVPPILGRLRTLFKRSQELPPLEILAEYHGRDSDARCTDGHGEFHSLIPVIIERLTV